MSSGGDHTTSPPLLDGFDDLGIPGIVDAVVVGRGGFGSVYKARQPALSRTVAVKILTDALQDETARLRFERECFAMGMLGGHPNIIQVYESGFTGDGRPYIVMDYMAEGALADRLEHRGPYDWRDLLPIAVRLAGALETAHRAGVLHRDIKPENVLISKYGEPQLADFGIARLQGAQQTRTDTLTASIAHAAPELLTGQPPSVQSDLYALGSALFMLLTGSAAFLRDTDQSLVPVLSRIGRDPVPDLRTRGIPDAVAALVERLMAKDPAQRFESAEAFGREVQRVERALGLDVTSLALIGEQQPDIHFDASATTNIPVASTLPSLAAPPASTDVPATAEPTAPAVPAPPPPPAAPAKTSRTSVLVAGGLVLALVAGAAVFFALQRPAPPAQVATTDGGGLDAQALTALRMNPDGVEGDWLLDPDLSAQLLSNPDEYLCNLSADPANVTAAAAISYRGGTPGPRVANILRAFKPGEAQALMQQLPAQAVCLSELGGLSDISSAPAPAGEEALTITYTRPGARLALEIVLVYARRGNLISQVVHLGYPETDDTVTEQLTTKLDEQLKSIPTT